MIHAFHLEAETRGEVLLVANHHVDERRERAVHLLRLLLPADGFPQRRPVVEIVADDGAVPLGGLHGFEHNLRGGLGERGVNAAGVQPAHAQPAEDVLPIHLARPHLAGGGVRPIGDAHRAAHAVTALREVQPHPRVAPDAIEGHPLDESRVHPALQDEVLDQSPHLVFREGRDHGGALAEAPAQPARHVVFPAALPDLKLPRRADAAFARIEAKHDFPEGELVKGALLGGTK